jgi:phage tail sheath gpL-like
MFDSRFEVKENVEYVLRDKDGNIKPLFQENRLFTWLMKKGILSPNFYKIPFLLGHWNNAKLVSNLVTNAGRGLISGRINGSGSPAAATYIEVGAGTTAAAAGDTALQTAITDSGLARVNGTVSLVTTTVTNDTAQVTTTFSVTGTKAVTEAGLLNASSSGTLLCRQVFSAINVVSGDSLTVTWKVQNT